MGVDPIVRSVLVAAVRRPVAGRRVRRLTWGAGPRGLVLFVLATVLLLGGGRRWWLAIKARRTVERLSDADVAPGEIESVADYGRDGIMDLFRLMETAPSADQRKAAGLALAKLWKRDQLVAEEEKAVVTRAYLATWKARRRYPRALKTPVPMAIEFGLSFLDRDVSASNGDADRLSPTDLEFSYRITGAQRESLEQWSPWRALSDYDLSGGNAAVAFLIEPGDFSSNGPHRLALHMRVRPKGLTSRWEHDLPAVSFSFEFDPNLRIESILGTEDDDRRAAMDAALHFAAPGSLPTDADGGTPDAGGPSDDLNEEFVLRAKSPLRVAHDRPADLAHRAEIEFDGIPGKYPAGVLVCAATRSEGALLYPVRPTAPLPGGVIPAAGERAMRVILTPDPHLAWADPNVRSLWPGAIVTGWTTVRIARK